MTVIVFDGKTLAADKRMLSHRTKQLTTKLHRLGCAAYAVTGTYGPGMSLLRWARDGKKRDDYPATARGENGAALIEVLANGECWRYDEGPDPYLVEAPCAFGCGDEPALAALLCGKDAREAVRIASLVNNGCGGGVTAIDVDELKSP